MEITEKIVQVKDYLTKSNLPTSDYVINPYVGCPHGCKYCYACFMKRFTFHGEEWGNFIDVKMCAKPLDLKKITGKSIFLSSVTDCYNQFESKYLLTRNLLNQLKDCDCALGISTKSDLILRDLDILKMCKNLTVSVSINTLDEKFKDDMDSAPSIERRLNTLKTLHENGIKTVLFMSPIFPEITDFKKIIEASDRYCDEYWFENLNLRGAFKQKIMQYIFKNYPESVGLYEEIYHKKRNDYWESLSEEIARYCEKKGLKYVNYFYHKKLVDEKKKAK